MNEWESGIVATRSALHTPLQCLDSRPACANTQALLGWEREAGGVGKSDQKENILEGPRSEV